MPIRTLFLALSAWLLVACSPTVVVVRVENVQFSPYVDMPPRPPFFP